MIGERRRNTHLDYNDSINVLVLLAKLQRMCDLPIFLSLDIRHTI